MKAKELLMSKARQDFDACKLDESKWNAFYLGYLAALRRFGGR